VPSDARAILQGSLSTTSKVLTNKRGHVQTLVASHPGNANAAKAGVYSRRILEPRVAELEGTIESLPATEVRRDIARRDLAGLVALTEALDATLADGIVGARGQVKDLVRMRLRASTVLRAAVLEYDASVAAVDELARLAEPPETGEEPTLAVQGDLLAELAESLFVASIAELEPLTFDAETFLEVVAKTTDPSVRDADRNRADRFLLNCRDARAEDCSCRAFRRARDADEFQEWVDDYRLTDKPAVNPDRYLAAVVRAFADGKQLEPAWTFERRMAALRWLVDYEVRRARGEEVHEGGKKEEEEDRRIQRLSEDPVLQRFWGTLLSTDTKTVKDRLDAFAKLDRAGALRRCVCPGIEHPLKEVVEDSYFAFLIRLSARTNTLGANFRANVPESFAALREMLDQKILADRGVETREDAGSDVANAKSAVT